MAESDVAPEDKVANVYDIRKSWLELRKDIKLRFIQTDTYTSTIQNLFRKLEKIVEKKELAESDKRTGMMLFRILRDESKSQILLLEVRSLLPSELILINDYFLLHAKALGGARTPQND